MNGMQRILQKLVACLKGIRTTTTSMRKKMLQRQPNRVKKKNDGNGIVKNCKKKIN